MRVSALVWYNGCIELCHSLPADAHSTMGVSSCVTTCRRSQYNGCIELCHYLQTLTVHFFEISELENMVNVPPPPPPRQPQPAIVLYTRYNWVDFVRAINCKHLLNSMPVIELSGRESQWQSYL